MLNRRKEKISSVPVKLNRRFQSPVKYNSHWDLIVDFGPGICFVCGQSLKKKLYIYIGKHVNGQDLYRHESCCPGSIRWLHKFNGYVRDDINQIIKEKNHVR